MLSPKKLKALIKEEKQAAKMYRKYGYKSIAKDESRHAKILTKKLRKK